MNGGPKSPQDNGIRGTPHPSESRLNSQNPAVLIVIAAFAALFAWHVIWLNDCRNYNSNGDVISGWYFLKSGCPKVGPYAPNGNILSVVIYALFHP